MSVLALITVTFVVMLLVVGGMALGVMNGREPIKGSCGGLNADGRCSFCEGSGSCERRSG
ncbi:MAG: hypothetical protein P8008_04125 [Gammaproteobacteria bacterium]